MKNLLHHIGDDNGTRVNKREVFGIVGERTLLMRLVYIFFSLIFLFFSIRIGNILSIVLSVLIFMAIFLKKKNIINDNGVQILYDMRYKIFVDEWSWNDITSLHWEKNKTTIIPVHFGKGTLTRTFFIHKDDLEDTINYASNANPTIVIAMAK